MIQGIKTGLYEHPRRLLILAACLHLVATITIFVIGWFSLMPSQFDSNGVGDFAPDGRMHQGDALALTEKLGNHGVGAWLTGVAPLHVRIYSLSQVLLSRLIGFNILTVEPINLFFYLAILVMVYKIAEAVFDRRSALLAATVVALWPTFLLHTTQPLRDPLLIALVIAFFLIATRLMTQALSWRQTIIASVLGSLFMLAIWVVRLAMWDVVKAVVALTAVLVIVRQVRERRVLLGNAIVVVIFIYGIWGIPQGKKTLQFTEKRQADVSSGRVLIAEKVVDLSLWARIKTRRHGFIDRQQDRNYQARSDVDSDVRFQNRRDIIWYLPRAMAIGLFAPFPNMWFAEGLTVGWIGRVISGVEMMLTYLIVGLALIALWQKRKHLSVWLLSISVLLGVTALGLIVTNIGSLYRLRYAFWILLVILGAGGAVHLASRHSRPPRESEATTL